MSRKRIEAQRLGRFINLADRCYDAQQGRKNYGGAVVVAALEDREGFEELSRLLPDREASTSEPAYTQAQVREIVRLALENPHYSDAQMQSMAEQVPFDLCVLDTIEAEKQLGKTLDYKVAMFIAAKRFPSEYNRYLRAVGNPHARAR